MTHGDPDLKQNQVPGSTYLISAIARFKGVPSVQWCFFFQRPRLTPAKNTLCSLALDAPHKPLAFEDMHP